MIKRPTPKQRRSKHLCADAGYRGKNAMKIILAHGYIPHVVGRKSEAERKKRNPQKKARRWVVEACHGWFNRFRKLLVRYEKAGAHVSRFNHLAAAIITLRKITSGVAAPVEACEGWHPWSSQPPTPCLWTSRAQLMLLLHSCAPALSRANLILARCGWRSTQLCQNVSNQSNGSWS